MGVGVKSCDDLTVAEVSARRGDDLGVAVPNTRHIVIAIQISPTRSVVQPNPRTPHDMQRLRVE